MLPPAPTGQPSLSVDGGFCMTQRLRGSGIDAKGFLQFIDNAAGVGVRPFAIRYYKQNELLLAADFAPYAADSRIRVYSLSKAFTSAAVGIAIGDGVLSLDDRVCDIFSRYASACSDERLQKMTLHDLLSMQSGHERCHLDRMISSKRSVKTFLEQEMKYEPGTTFVYSTAGTLMCGAAVTERTGIPLDAFINERLFAPLGLKPTVWDKTPDGICLGGIGLHVGADDILQFGIAMLEGGKGIIPSDYVNLATKAHSIDKNNGSADWISGYGYQFWLNSRGGYRADGAFGQLCIVEPQSESVFVILAEAVNMQREMDVIYDFLHDYQPGRGDVDAAAKLVDTLYIPNATKPLAAANEYNFADNPYNISRISLRPDGMRIIAEIKCDHGTQRIICGNGEYVHNSFLGFNMLPAIAQLKEHDCIDRMNVYAAYEIDGDGVKISLRHSDAPHTQIWRFAADGLHMQTYVGDLPSTLISYACKN